RGEQEFAPVPIEDRSGMVDDPRIALWRYREVSCRASYLHPTRFSPLVDVIVTGGVGVESKRPGISHIRPVRVRTHTNRLGVRRIAREAADLLELRGSEICIVPGIHRNLYVRDR